jgi:hypothetical protein
MKRFQFPLEQVLRYRQLQMESEHAKLEQLVAKTLAIDQLEANLARQRLEADDDLRRRTERGSAIDPTDVGAMNGFRAYCRQMAQTLAARRAELEHQIAIQRRELLEARKRYEVLNRFRGHSADRWSFEFAKEQNSLAEENYLARWHRRT